MREFRREPLRNGEPERLLAACATDFERAAIGVLLETGLRRAELCSITEEQVDWAENRLRVVGKGDKRRVIPLSPAAEQALRLWLSLPRLRAPMIAVNRAVAVAAERAGIAGVFPHRLRHTFAVKCLKRGIGLRTLQLLLGHQSIATTQHYLNLSPEEVIEEFREKWR